MTTPTTETPTVRTPFLAGILVLLFTLGMLINYKAGGAMGAISKVQSGGTISPKVLSAPTWVGDSAASLHAVNYVGWVVIALTYGLILGAAIKAILPQEWLAKSVGAPGAKGQLLGGLMGAPLMLCSCCATPVFEGVYRRTGRMGPSLAMLLAPPALNPGALVLTFLLFPNFFGIGRLIASLAIVLLGAAWVGDRFSAPNPPDPSGYTQEPQTWLGLLRAFWQALIEVSIRSLPAILIGIGLSAWLITAAPIPAVAHSFSGLPLLLIVGLLATLIAIPTFAEIPIALALMHGGAPDAVVLIVLIATPSINLPSLLGLAKLASPKVALATGTMVFSVSVAAGLLVGL